MKVLMINLYMVHIIEFIKLLTARIVVQPHKNIFKPMPFSQKYEKPQENLPCHSTT